MENAILRTARDCGLVNRDILTGFDCDHVVDCGDCLPHLDWASVLPLCAIHQLPAKASHQQMANIHRMCRPRPFLRPRTLCHKRANTAWAQRGSSDGDR